MKTKKYEHPDEWLFLSVVHEASKAFGTFSARVVFVKSKLERISLSRLAKAKKDADQLGEEIRLIERHRAKHYALTLPWEVLEEEVEAALAMLEGLSEDERESFFGGRGWGQ